ncbi:MAG: MinD/ParA family protein [Lachnospiraceae bacterium]|nr:MinD/ParA family protein [Lachnospiraceae bacterium]MDD7334267.1 MinD/ParA family protein [Lachnospiraceae bacterium]MDY3275293.1 MinD/ParA family protein [Agathobacter sp.]MDY5102722.1 MinD/ParA family protein [Agathobacter sp.]MDY5521233.1 MinD/ParA family protein [Agathobacter sp.]
MDQAQQLRNVIKLRDQNNQKVEASQMARVVTVTSGKGGVGKSNLAVNLAVQLRKAGKRVIIFDADFGLANVEVMFGAIPQYNLSDFIYRGKRIQEIITPGPMDIGFISGGSGIIGLNNLYREQIMYLVKAIEELNTLADYIIIDTGAGISDQVLEFVMASPEVLLVSTPEPSSLTDSYSLLKALYRNPNFVAADTTIHVISNRVSSLEEGQAVFDKLNSVVSQFLHGKLNYLGMIPQDAALDKAVRQQKTVSLLEPASKSAKAFEVLADNLMNGTHNQVLAKRGIVQMFSGFLQKRK